MKKRIALLLVLLSVLASGCAPLLIGGAAAGGLALADRRTIGSQVDDAAVEVKAAGLLDAKQELHDVHVNTTSVNGIVLLSGEAPTPELRDEVLREVRSIPSIRRINNEIRIAPPSSFEDRAYDSWLTGKVKTHLLLTRGVHANQIKVVTENQVVYLMGLVSRQESDLAAGAAANVNGVTRVVKLFEYLD